MSIVLKDKGSFILLKRYGLAEKVFKMVESGMEYLGSLDHTPAYYSRREFGKMENNVLKLNEDEFRQIIDGRIKEVQDRKESVKKYADNVTSSCDKKLVMLSNIRKKA